VKIPSTKNKLDTRYKIQKQDTKILVTKATYSETALKTEEYFEWIN
jgi:hypothetical protein